MLSSSRRAIFRCWGLTRHNWRQPDLLGARFHPIPSKLGSLAAERGVRLIGALTIKALQALLGSREKVGSNQTPVVVCGEEDCGNFLLRLLSKLDVDDRKRGSSLSPCLAFFSVFSLTQYHQAPGSWVDDMPQSAKHQTRQTSVVSCNDEIRLCRLRFDCADVVHNSAFSIVNDSREGDDGVD